MSLSLSSCTEGWDSDLLTAQVVSSKSQWLFLMGHLLKPGTWGLCPHVYCLTHLPAQALQGAPLTSQEAASFLYWTSKVYFMCLNSMACTSHLRL